MSHLFSFRKALEKEKKRVEESENSLVQVNKNWMEEYEKLKEKVKRELLYVQKMLASVDVSEAKRAIKNVLMK